MFVWLIILFLGNELHQWILLNDDILVQNGVIIASNEC